MKIVFSRKGFDSKSGGFPSPIFPDGTVCSIPIPTTLVQYDYSHIKCSYEREPIQEILNQLTNKLIKNGELKCCDYASNAQACHYDPMEFQQEGYLALGQAENAEAHLRNQGVQEGDQFIFYGLFQPVNKTAGVWSYKRDTPPVHLIWSWMKIGRRFHVEREADLVREAYPFLDRHPHLNAEYISRNRGKINGIYVSSNYQKFKFSDTRVLTDTKNYSGCSTWRLPICFNQPDAFSYLKSFSAEGNDVVTKFRGYGQEFVLNLDRVDQDGRHDILSYLDNILNA